MGFTEHPVTMKALMIVLVLILHPGVSNAADPGAKPSVRITVKAVSEGTERSKHTAVSSRRLKILIENREHQRLDGLKLQWKIFGEDVRSHKKEVDAKGGKPVTLEPDGNVTVESDVARFTGKDGGVKTTGKGRNQRRVALPDTGRDYAGYAVELLQDGRVIAESSTLGLGRK